MGKSVFIVACVVSVLCLGLTANAQPTADNTPPTISAITTDPGFLWPPNHKMKQVQVFAVVTDDTDTAPTFRITDVTSNEDESAADTDAAVTTPDWEIISDHVVDLRAERLGSGDGRIYTITIEASDASGNTSTETVDVYVPHDMGHKNALKEAWKQQKKEFKQTQKEARRNAKQK